MQVCRQPHFHLLPRRRPSDILVCRACGRKCQSALPKFHCMTMPPKEAKPRHMCKQAHNPLRPAALRTMLSSLPTSEPCASVSGGCKASERQDCAWSRLQRHEHCPGLHREGRRVHPRRGPRHGGGGD